MKYIENIKGTNQHKIQNEKGLIIIDANSKEEAVEIYKVNYTPFHDKKRELLAKVKNVVTKKLSATDYKVTRHQGQSYLVQNGELDSTSITDVEYKALEKERQSIRDWSNAKEIEINNATTIEELKNIDTNYENARI